MKPIYCSENPVITIKDLFRIRRNIQLHVYKYQIAVKYMKLKFGVKTNMRLGNDAMVVSNMTKLLKDKKLKKNKFLLEQMHFYRKLLNEEKDSAVARLK
jgi:hypothetical protein